MNLLQKVESGMVCPDWHTAMHSLRLQRLLWICCPGHTGVSGNERAKRLVCTTDITSGLQLGRGEMLRGLRNFLNMDRPEHHSTDPVKERSVERGSSRHSTLEGWEWSVFNQTNIGTVSRATLGRLLSDGAEHVWAFPSATMPSWAETDTETCVIDVKLREYARCLWLCLWGQCGNGISIQWQGKIASLTCNFCLVAIYQIIGADLSLRHTLPDSWMLNNHENKQNPQLLYSRLSLLLYGKVWNQEKSLKSKFW